MFFELGKVYKHTDDSDPYLFLSRDNNGINLLNLKNNKYDRLNRHYSNMRDMREWEEEVRPYWVLIPNYLDLLSDLI